jgi:formate hydrogenlyase subunit 3/multisubunit Na+/H+ antiporter MnhD subunit
MLWYLIAIPLLAGLIAFVVPWNWPRRLLFLATALAHAGLTAQTFRKTPDAVLNGWIGLDAASSLFLAITSFVFLITAFYAIGYMRRESARSTEASGIELPFKNYPEATFTGCCLLFLAAMTLVNLSRH